MGLIQKEPHNLKVGQVRVRVNLLKLGPHERVLLQGLGQGVPQVGDHQRGRPALAQGTKADGVRPRHVTHGAGAAHGGASAERGVVAHHVSHELLRVLQRGLELVPVS